MVTPIIQAHLSLVAILYLYPLGWPSRINSFKLTQFEVSILEVKDDFFTNFFTKAFEQILVFGVFFPFFKRIPI